MENEEIRQEYSDFLLFYAKFENALKETGYYKKSREKNEINAEPDWNVFIKVVCEQKTATLLDGLKADADVAAFLAQPPKDQKAIKDGNKWNMVLEPQGPLPSSETSKILWKCKKVKDTLFHGGQAASANFERGCVLIRAARKILEQVLTLECDGVSKVKKHLELTPGV